MPAYVHVLYTIHGTFLDKLFVRVVIILVQWPATENTYLSAFIYYIVSINIQGMAFDKGS